MKLTWTLFLAFAIIPALTGCIERPTAPAAPTPPVDPKTNTTNSDQIILSQCTGFDGSTSYPRAIAPGHTPPGWEPENPTVLTSGVSLEGYECERIHIGPYERGPVRILWDAHNNADIPPKCFEGELKQSIPVILNALIIDDEELSNYLEGFLNLPVQHFDIDIEREEIGSLRRHTWSWGLGEEKSFFQFTDDGTADSFDGAERLFWQHASGIAFIDISFTRQATVFTHRDGEGQMEPPMLLSEEETNSFVGPINYYSQLSAEGRISIFDDFLCEHQVNKS